MIDISDLKLNPKDLPSGQSGNRSKKDSVFLNTLGPGNFLLRVTSVRQGEVENQQSKNYGRVFFAANFTVEEAPDPEDVGKDVSVVLIKNNGFFAKFVAGLAAAILGTDLGGIVPEGYPAAGEIIPLITSSNIESLSSVDFTTNEVRIEAEQYEVEKKGRTFTNARYSVPGGAPTIEEMIDSGALDLEKHLAELGLTD